MLCFKRKRKPVKGVVARSSTPLIIFKTVEGDALNTINYQQILKIVSYPKYVTEEFITNLNDTLTIYKINTKLRICHFLAQVLHESGELRFVEEVWGPTPAQLRYEGREDLGNTEPGDGYKYRGRGLIQLTGRSNYRTYSEYRNVDFISNPDLVSEYPNAIDVAGWYWSSRGLNDIADADDLYHITRIVNGGYNGIADRERLLNKCKEIV